MPGLFDRLEKSRTNWGSLYGLVEPAFWPTPGASLSRFSFCLALDSPLVAAAAAAAAALRPPLPLSSQDIFTAVIPPLPGSLLPLPPCHPCDADAADPAPSLAPPPSSSAAINPTAPLVVVLVAVEKF